MDSDGQAARDRARKVKLSVFDGGRASSAYRGIEHWQDAAGKNLPSKGRPIERCYAMAATYALWYQTRPDLLKWAGMNAFATYQVAEVLRPYADLLHGERDTASEIGGRKDDPWREEARDRRALPVIRADVELLLRGEELTFLELGWAHAAICSGAGGPAMVAEIMGRRRGREELYAAFNALAASDERMRGGATRAVQSDVWRANRAIALFQHCNVVQPVLESVRRSFRLVQRCSSHADFAADLAGGGHLRSSFYRYMYTLGLPAVSRGGGLARIGSFQQRWRWVERRLLPMWRRVDQRDPLLEAKMRGITEVAQRVRSSGRLPGAPSGRGALP